MLNFSIISSINEKLFLLIETSVDSFSSAMSSSFNRIAAFSFACFIEKALKKPSQ
ncbi:hypothetical protein EHE19_014525 [Ruminiclostridium herbifermentans]|uniref:Uncharacterized protein n=1 Tax=Ruminiclostridium herbifermentans TaxID=2488810 RepID=A0A7H1VL25_9FIRM|nr:hypothetical protein EHE19_014525 [Ruminiclostridium herbifermentans]